MNTKNCISIDPVLLEAYKNNTGIDIPKAKACMRFCGIYCLSVALCLLLAGLLCVGYLLFIYGYHTPSLKIEPISIFGFVIIVVSIFYHLYIHEKNHRIVTPIDFQINTIIRKMYLPNTPNNEPITKELLIKAAEKAAFGIMRAEWARLKVSNLGISQAPICIKDRAINTVEKISRRHRENFRLIMKYLKLFGIECSETEMLRTGYNMVEKMMIDRSLRRTQA